MNTQAFVYNIAHVCHQLGVKNAIICPGSRSAPLTLSFTNHPDFTPVVVFDERIAGYMALGMAQATGLPTVVICTSGTAALNLAPAVAEAYWQKVPLLVFTADRPAEWIAQGDGQSVYQQNMYGHNCKKFMQMPGDYVHKDAQWAFVRQLNEAYYTAQKIPKGPVHINFPLREPLYPASDYDFSVHNYTNKKVYIGYQECYLPKTEWDYLIELLIKYPKRMILAGHSLPNQSLVTVLNSFLEYNYMPMLADVTANLQGINHRMHLQEWYFTKEMINKNPDILPDLLITFGHEWVSKKLKNLLRDNPPKVHIHLADSGHYFDTFQSVTHWLEVGPLYFFKELMNKIRLPVDKKWNQQWVDYQMKAEKQLYSLIQAEKFSEILVFNHLLESIPDDAILHAANSLSIRYINLLSVHGKVAEVFCNRGTSGIDGCTSTALGHALATEKLVVLITGDMAFLYDRNAFWHNNIPSNLRIIVINNRGGNIFSWVDGAAKRKETQKYFVTEQNYTAESVAREYKMEYYPANDMNALKAYSKILFKNDSKIKLLEVFTNGEASLQAVKNIRNNLKL